MQGAESELCACEIASGGNECVAGAVVDEDRTCDQGNDRQDVRAEAQGEERGHE